MYCKIKKFKTNKIILLKIFLLQQKNKLTCNINVNLKHISFLFFLWKEGYILGFSCIHSTLYTIFLNKRAKQFSIQFLEQKLNSNELQKCNVSSTVKVPIIFCNGGLKSRRFISKSSGGFLLCNLF